MRFVFRKSFEEVDFHTCFIGKRGWNAKWHASYFLLGTCSVISTIKWYRNSSRRLSRTKLWGNPKCISDSSGFATDDTASKKVLDWKRAFCRGGYKWDNRNKIILTRGWSSASGNLYISRQYSQLKSKKRPRARLSYDFENCWKKLICTCINPMGAHFNIATTKPHAVATMSNFSIY